MYHVSCITKYGPCKRMAERRSQENACLRPPKCYHKALALQKTHHFQKKRSGAFSVFARLLNHQFPALPASPMTSDRLCDFLKTRCFGHQLTKKSKSRPQQNGGRWRSGDKDTKNIEIQIIFQLRKICRKNIEQWLMIESHRNNDLHTHNNHRRTFLERIPPCLHFWNLKC